MENTAIFWSSPTQPQPSQKDSLHAPKTHRREYIALPSVENERTIYQIPFISVHEQQDIMVGFLFLQGPHNKITTNS